MAENKFDELFEDYTEEAVEVAEEVVEPVDAPAKSVPTLSLPEWKEAVAGLEKAGLVDVGADYFEVKAALVAFQESVGIRGITEGYPNEATLEALKGA